MSDVNEQREFLMRISQFVAEEPSRLKDVIDCATQGLQDAFIKRRDMVYEMECILMHHIAMNKIPGLANITYKTIADKLSELESKKVLNFKWEHIIDAMRDTPELLAPQKRRKSTKETKDDF